ncbi:MFS general substrate transporter [Coprinopsis marcescibilis]|uniref:Lysosomal dipeptide transporter MFSD1 n=1 Tax=Coprinopsis marcescibilis TaxID=230819 RepID=A0A5C3LEX3_COPMA|nr:MFS general substrate transporter [Coprinopsis marcescibilis]
MPHGLGEFSDHTAGPSNDLNDISERPFTNDFEVNALPVSIEAESILDTRSALHTSEDLTTKSLADAQRRAFVLRTIALLCACSFSIGSHYASNILGPLKSRLHRELGTSHTEFGLLIAAYSLNSTWTPLVGGLMANRLGTTFTSILATGVIFLGQLLLLVGDICGNVRLMALGLFVFGLGISPLAVIQETIIVRFFRSHGLGLSMAFGLIAGKGASFLSARTAYPLTERFGTRAPFYVATSLTALSVVTNLVYLACSRWLVTGAGAELEAADIKHEARKRMNIDMTGAQALEHVAERKYVKIRSIIKLGDVFWAYVCANIFCGMIWAPFIHLAPNLIEQRFGLSEHEAAVQGSYLLAGSMVLYPVCGYLVDTIKQRNIILRLLLLASVFTLGGYMWLASPPNLTKNALPGIFAFAFGHGYSPLLLVVLVPQIVPSKYVSTALGVHKCMEQTGSTLFQTMAGLLLDSKKPKGNIFDQEMHQYLLDAFVILNVLQFLSILFLGYLRRKQVIVQNNAPKLSRVDIPEAEPLLQAGSSTEIIQYTTIKDSSLSENELEGTADGAELQRGKVMAFCCVALFVSAWVLFMCTAWAKLGKGK